jgi:hypothetical protein
VVGVVTYYLLHTIRFAVDHGASSGYLMNATHLAWLIAALLVGPVMGVAGAVSTRSRPPVLAVIAPAVILLAEAGHLVLDRRPWRWSLAQELYRLADVGVFVVLVALALALPALLIPERGRRRSAYAALVICGAGGGSGSACSTARSSRWHSRSRIDGLRQRPARVGTRSSRRSRFDRCP